MGLRPVNVISTFAGVGGNDLGVRLAVPDARTVCYVEREAYPVEVLVSRIEDGTLDDAPVWSDITSFRGGEWRGFVSGIVGSPPCQPFSVAGKRGNTEDERWLWDDFFRVVRDARPRWVFLENVPNIVRYGLPYILSDLASLGFDAEWGMFSAQDVGAPQKRERFWLLAHTRCGSYGQIQYGAGEHQNSPATIATNADASGQTMEHSERPRWESRSEVGEQLLSGRPSEGYFPPPQNGNWGDWNGPQPGVQRESNGLSFGMDGRLYPYWRLRLAAMGNAVVPLVSAVAFTELAHRLGLQHDDLY